MASKDKRRIIGVAVCGFGRAGQIHFHGIRQNHNCKLKYVVDMIENPSVLETIREKLAEYHMTGVRPVSREEFEELVLKDPEVEAVVVATPTDSHEYYTRKSLEAGRGVFCEKPVAGNLRDVSACYEIARENGLLLYCAFNRRFDAGMRNVYEQVREGKIGKLYQIKTCSRDASPPTLAYVRVSDGMFHDTAVHDIDMVCWVVGEEPVKVIAEGTAFDEGIKSLGDVDTIAIILKFPSGVIASIDMSRHSSYGYDQRLEVLGEKGMLRMENITEDSVSLSSGGGVTTKPPLFAFQKRYEQAYKLEMEHFIAVLQDPSLPPCVTREQTLLASRVAEACKVSLREGRAVNLSDIKLDA